MAVANDFLPTVLQRLPKDVVLLGHQDCFDAPITVLKLCGDGLPEWCEEPKHGEHYRWAAGIFGGDGVMRFAPAQVMVPVQKMNGSGFERIVEQYGNKN